MHISLLITQLIELLERSEDERLPAAWDWAQSIRPLVLREARRLLPVDCVEDAVQDALLRLATKVLHGRLSVRSVRNAKAWLTTIIRRTVHDVARPIWRVRRRYELRSEFGEIGVPATELACFHGSWRSWGMGAVDGFVLVAMSVPELVSESDVIAAVRASEPPRVGLSRDAATTWRLFDQWRQKPGRNNRDLYFILRGESEARWTTADSRRARNWAYTRVRRAKAAAARSLRPSSSDPVRH